MGVFWKYKKKYAAEKDCVLAEPQVDTYIMPRKLIQKNDRPVDESYEKWIADNFSWEAIDSRLKAIECQTVMGDKEDCVADSEANGRVRESLPWLK